MKLNGFVGKGSGKLGASVFAISGGEQIVRQYNPQVANPNTDAQVAQRAKLKLLSQLAVVFRSGMAFQKEGLVSARNKFIQANMPKTSYSEGSARINVEQILLTPGVLSLPDVQATRGTGENLQVQLTSPAAENIGSVIYVCAEKNENDELAIVGLVTNNTSGTNHTFAGSVKGSTRECVVFAYGLVFGSAAGKVKYLSYYAESENNSAVLDTSKLVAVSGATTTVTKGVTVAAQ